MLLTGSLISQRIWVNLAVTSKEALLTEIAQLIAASGVNAKAERILSVLLEREALGSTGIENGVAIPHARLSEISSPILAVGTTQQAIAFGAVDEKPSDLFFIILAPTQSGRDHLAILAQLSRLIHHTQICQQLRNSHSATEIQTLITQWEETHSC